MVKNSAYYAGSFGSDKYSMSGRSPNLDYMSSSSLSTATPGSKEVLKKLASLELGGSSLGVNGSLHTETDPEEGSFVGENGSREKKKYVIRILDHVGGHSAGSSVGGSYSTATGTIDSTSVTYPPSVRSIHAPNRNPQSVATSQNVVNGSQVGTIPSQHTIVDNSIEDRNPVRTERGYAETQIQNRSVMGSAMQCLFPTVPGESSVPMRRKSQVVAMNALRANNEDALDMVFGAVERFSCRDELDLRADLRESRIVPPLGTKPTFQSRFLDRMEPPSSAKQDSHEYTLPTKQQPSRQSSQQPSQQVTVYEKDLLDNVFEGVERYTCRGDTVTHQPTTAYQQDALDNVFDSVEKFARREEMNERHLHQSGRSSLDDSRLPADPPALKAKGKVLLKEGEKYGNWSYQPTNQDKATSQKVQTYGKRFDIVANQKYHHSEPSRREITERDCLDAVCEPVELRTCGPSDDRYVDLTSYEVDARVNSIVDKSRIGDSFERRSSSDSEKYEYDRRQSVTGQAYHSKRVQPQGDMLDYVFDNMESAVCSHEVEDGMRSRHRARQNLERARNLRMNYNGMSHNL